MAVTVRFAPSPTGFLHIGNLRPALFNRLFARGAGDRFILRLDDTDRERSKDEYAEAIREDLGWIGIRWDEFHRQSDRLDRYADAAERLRAAGLLYACYETAEELDTRRRLLLAERRPPIYGRTALRLTGEDHRRYAAEGRRPHWRFLLPNHDGDPFRTRRTEVRWDDLVRGPQAIDLASLSDPVLVREDATQLYTFTSVVDDAEMAVSHVIRGEDHLTNTAVQIALFEALGADLPVFAHHNLLTTIDGEGLSKRTGALSLRTLRDEGYEPMAVASLAALTGAAGAVEALPDLAALAKRFDLAAVSRSSAKFDPDDLGRLNGEIVHAMPVEAAAPRLRGIGVPEESLASFWLAVRGNCDRVGDAAFWWHAVAEGSPAQNELDGATRDFLRLAAELLPAEPFDASTWKGWTEALKGRTGRKGRDLFLPLRRSLTGHEHGPELAALLPLIGRDRALERLGR